MYETLNDEQRRVFQDIRAALTNSEQSIFFVDGPGGIGKSYLFETLLRYVRGQGDIAVACAWSGLAAFCQAGARAMPASGSRCPFLTKIFLGL